MSLFTIRVTPEKRAVYTVACAYLGTNVSKVCTAALENTVLLAEKVKSMKPISEQSNTPEATP
jgi:hypothetical protein